MSAPKDRLDLLLASDDGRPAIEEGLPGDSAKGAPRPKKMGDHNLRLHGGDASDLPTQRWAVVAPQGREGDRMLEAIEPLMQLREAEQGVRPMIFRAPPDLRAKTADQWKKQEYTSLEEAVQPYYLLLLGDLHHTAVELQYVLANDALVGRVHFADADGNTDHDGYAAYAEKVVRYAQIATPERAADILYYSAPDGSDATVLGKSKLIDPSLAASLAAQAQGKIAAARVIDAERVDDLLEGAGGARPSVLLSVSHGLGAPRRGWKSEDEQWRRQGALVINYDEILDAERLGSQPFLPGGMWFYLACFGMGTPKESAYHPWLSKLREAGAFEGNLAAVLHSLPKPDERGFLAALPQAALANPQGPLAVVGHIDLAWTYAFTGGVDHSESRAARIRMVLDILARGARAGVALNKLMDDYRDTNQGLTSSYESQSTPPDELAHLWMLRNDLRGYVLLGDPAARLPLQQFASHKPREPATPEVRTPAPGATLTTLERERLVMDTLRGEEAPQAIAARAGIPLETLWMWFDAYRAAVRKQPDA